MDTSIVSSGPIFILPLSVDVMYHVKVHDTYTWSELPILAADVNIRPCSLWQQTHVVMLGKRQLDYLYIFFEEESDFPLVMHIQHIWMSSCDIVGVWPIAGPGPMDGHWYNTDLCVPASRATRSSCWNTELPLWPSASHPYCPELSPPS